MDRELLAEECLEIERSGGDVLGHLAAVGCVSPWGTWFRLQKEQLGRSIDKSRSRQGRCILPSSKGDIYEIQTIT